LSRDGASAAGLAEIGRSEVLAYPTVTWRDARVAAVSGTPDGENGFVVRTQAEEFRAKRLILATGVVDDLPAIPGLSQRWGRSVFHCPYCHGYELNRGRLGMLATTPLSLHMALLISEWSAPGQATLFLNGVFEPDVEQQAELAARGVRVERERIEAFAGEAPAIEVRLRDGRVQALEGLFVMPSTRAANPFAEQLGCALEAGPMGLFYKADAMTRETSVPGVFACGDVALPAGSVALVVADGVRAGVGAHRSLVFTRH
jgi:thioredoxin reductase